MGEPVIRWLGAAAALALLLVVGWPLLRLVAALDVAAVAALLDGSTWIALRNTVVVAVGSTLFAVVVGVPLGLAVGRSDLPGADGWRAALSIPYLVPPYVTAIAWIALLNPTNGWINRIGATFGAPVLDIYTLGGMVWVMGLESAPLVMMATADAARRADPALEEAARIAGATPATVLRRVTLPLVAPTVAEAAGLVIAATTAAFGVPYLLSTGASQPRHLLTTRIYQALDLSPGEGRPIAVALSALLLVVGLGMPALLRLAALRWRGATVGGKAARPPVIGLGRWRWVAAVGVGTYALVAAGLPLATLVATSLLRTYGRGFVWSNMGFETWAAVLGRADTRGAIFRSLYLGAGAATAAVMLGLLLAILQERTRLRGRRALTALARAPYAIPGTVLALGMLLAWSQEVRFILADRVTFALALAGSGWLLGIAYTAKYLAIPVGASVAALGSVDASLEEAARISGAGPLRAWRAVTIPLIRRDLASAWILVFLPCFTEVTLSVLLAGPDSRVLGAVLFALQTYGDPPAAAVLAVLATAVVLAGNLALGRVGGERG